MPLDTDFFTAQSDHRTITLAQMVNALAIRSERDSLFGCSLSPAMRAEEGSLPTAGRNE
ncbi:MAG TPA: hypothetical protein VFU22_25125 [Roseiflexaceae bacterium]|nr:hypothetical protein [Roseiflexaceae bacterium]